MWQLIEGFLEVKREQHSLLYTECQSSFIPVSYWLRTYHVIVKNSTVSLAT